MDAGQRPKCGCRERCKKSTTNARKAAESLVSPNSDYCPKKQPANNVSIDIDPDDLYSAAALARMLEDCLRLSLSMIKL